MEKEVDKYKIRIRGFTAELGEDIDDTLRTLVTSEMDIESFQYVNNEDGTYDMVYNAKQNGVTIVKQGKDKVVKTKSKRRHSQKLRQALWSINPDEGFYDVQMNKIIYNLEEVIEFLRDK